MAAFGDIPTEYTLWPAHTGEFDHYDEGTVFDTSGLTDATPEQQESFLQNVLGQAGQTVEVALTQLGKIRAEFAVTVGRTPVQQEVFVQTVLSKACPLVTCARTDLGTIPGAVVVTSNQTLDVFGKTLHVGTSLASLAINKLAGGPISLVFDV